LFFVLSEDAPKGFPENKAEIASRLAILYPEIAGDAAIQDLAKSIVDHWKADSVSLENGAAYVSVPKEETLSILGPTGLLEANLALAHKIASDLL
jgi:hypothetical protein